MKEISKLLAQYEKEMGCVCERKRCTRQASHIVTWHVMDECTEPGMPPTGNLIYLLCAPCAKDTVDRYRQKVNSMKDAMRLRDSRGGPGYSLTPLECTSCGKRVNKLSDVCKMERLIYRLNVKSVGGQ